MALPLTRFGTSVQNVFALAGDNENSATAAVGWVLSQSPKFLANLLKELLPGASQASLRIDMQRRAGDAGFTDIEIHGPNLHVIIEAKVGLAVPSEAQLRRYVNRLGNGPNRLLLSVSDASKAYATRMLPTEVDGIHVVHLRWSEIQAMSRAVVSTVRSPIEKLWLRQLQEHLEVYMTSRQITDNTVLVVALSKERIHPSGYTWIHVVNEGRYFHSVKNWPIPPNYLGFRYDGKLQSVHHVERWKIVDSLQIENGKWPSISEPCVVYCLGPAIVPAFKVQSGKIWNRRANVAIDLLLSGQCSTVKDAEDETNRRLKDA